MINVISRSVASDLAGGLPVVVKNLTKGLDKIGYPYVVNRALNTTKRLWIHDDTLALQYAARSRANTVVGPNLYVLPGDIPRKVDLSGLLYVQPSDWVVSVWKAAGFRACDLAVWPVGIDVDALCPSERAARSSKVLVYHKRRAEDELRTILSSLERAGLPYRVYRYGSYAQQDYLAELEDTGVVVWHGCHESQGIALQEALAMNVPILVCDVTRLSQEVGGRFPPGLDRVPVTSAPYFDDRCGLRAESLADVGEVVEQMLLGRSRFSPRTYVEENLSLDGQARRFVELWEHFGLSADDGYREPLLSSRPWRMPLRSRLAARSASLPAIASSASRRAQSVFRARLRA